MFLFTIKFGSLNISLYIHVSSCLNILHARSLCLLPVPDPCDSIIHGRFFWVWTCILRNSIEFKGTRLFFWFCRIVCVLCFYNHACRMTFLGQFLDMILISSFLLELLRDFFLSMTHMSCSCILLNVCENKIIFVWIQMSLKFSVWDFFWTWLYVWRALRILYLLVLLLDEKGDFCWLVQIIFQFNLFKFW